jgi:signal transduction histidine kinase
MKNLPLRWKLALHTAGLACLVLALFGVGVSWHLYNDGVADLDKEMHEVAHGFFAELERRHHTVDWSDQAAVDSLFPAVTTLYGIEISTGGTVVYRSRIIGDQPFPDLAGKRAFVTARFARKSMRLAHFASKDVTLHIAAELHAVDETREDLLESYFIAAPVVLLLVGLGSWWIAGRALAPIDEIADAARRITAQRLDRRLPVPTTSDEVARLTVVLNQMIDRLENSFLQATRFTADASHELKTPLTIIRGEIEAELRTGTHSPAQEKLLINLLEETTRLITITQNLLLLSRADAGKLQIETDDLDLSRFIGELLEDVEILAERRQIQIQVEIPTGILVRANEHFLRQLLLNLFDNAIKYNVDDGQLRLRVTPGRSTHVIAVANTGLALSPEHAAQVFDRFFRGDASRDRSVGGHGLGLSICREIARALEGEISVHLEEPGWTEFRVTLPAVRSGLAAKSTAAEEMSGLSSAPS